MSNKRPLLIIILAVILVLTAVAAYLLNTSEPQSPVNDNGNNQAGNSQTENSNSQNIGFTTSARVLRIEGQQLFVEIPKLITGQDGLSVFEKIERQVGTTSDTKYYFFSNTGSKKAAKFSDIKVNSQIMVSSFFDLSKGNAESATVIEIVN